ncbi:hypothetical protein QLQ12_44515 [Actinoplanes sp. NEAU-A12]|uniref:Uncharacterized protein n=1 Tax=Actinoplanes sandaracinus TaxID=3045177 RepID=A0ABT6X0Z6_9ACTN|nr:hypothetical protein [Actinoplanes sandaracinus]MDI6105668.1 hypothetical protein [Actinoplanes sandaracinus]
MSATLERGYLRLLNFYPAEYRRDRGAEILETLMAASDGRERPAPRESASLILGALRVRAGLVGRDSRPLVLHVAALALLVHFTVMAARRVSPYSFDLSPDVLIPVAALLGAVATIATWRHRPRTAILTASLAFVLFQVTAWPMAGPSNGEFWQVPLAVLLLLPALRQSAPAPARGVLRHLPLVAVPLAGLDGWAGFGAVATVSVAALVWLAVDARVAMALGLLLLNYVLVQVSFLAETAGTGRFTDTVVSLGLAVVSPALLLISSTTVARRI